VAGILLAIAAGAGALFVFVWAVLMAFSPRL